MISFVLDKTQRRKSSTKHRC